MDGNTKDRVEEAKKITELEFKNFLESTKEFHFVVHYFGDRDYNGFDIGCWWKRDSHLNNEYHTYFDVKAPQKNNINILIGKKTLEKARNFCKRKIEDNRIKYENFYFACLNKGSYYPKERYFYLDPLTIDESKCFHQYYEVKDPHYEILESLLIPYDYFCEIGKFFEEIEP